MRKDMAKQITECYRFGSKNKYRDIRGKMNNIDFADQPRKQGMRKPHTVYNWDGLKEFGENLAPLYRFLDQQVNRPWDKVYSEMCEHIKLDSATQLHILQHVFMHVELETWMGEDGEVYTTGWHDHPVCLSKTKEGYYGGQQLYVHPVTNLICKQKFKKLKRKKKRNPERYYLNDQSVLIKLYGLWHRYFVKPLPEPVWIPYSKEHMKGKPAWAATGRWTQDIPKDKISVEVFDSKNWRWDDRIHVPSGWYAYRKKQLNKKELKRYGLHNSEFE